MAMGMLSISSRNSVPPLACSILPMRRLPAPVKAPASLPNISLSNKVSGKPPQLMATKWPLPRGLASCRHRAASSLPVPVSPWMSTSTVLAAKPANTSRKRSMSGARPITRRSIASRCASWLRSWRTSSTSRRLSSARRTALTSCSGAKGFWMKSCAPSFMACTAIEMSPWPVISTTGNSGSRPMSSCKKAMPSIFGRRISLTTTPRKSRPRRRRASSALGALSVAMPSSCRACSQPRTMSGSSSTIRTLRWWVMGVPGRVPILGGLQRARSSGTRHRPRGGWRR